MILLILLIWVILNALAEINIRDYWSNTSDKQKLRRKFHIYDAVQRTIIIPYILYNIKADLLFVLVYSFILLGLYMILFNCVWNLFVGNHILYLGQDALEDRLVRKLGEITKIDYKIWTLVIYLLIIMSSLILIYLTKEPLSVLL